MTSRSLLSFLSFAMLLWGCSPNGSISLTPDSGLEIEIVADYQPQHDPDSIVVNIYNGTSHEIISGYPCNFIHEARSGESWTMVYRRDCSREKWAPDLVGPGESVERRLPFSSQGWAYSLHRISTTVTIAGASQQVQVSSVFTLPDRE